MLVTSRLKRALVLARALQLVCELVRAVAEVLAPRVHREREAEALPLRRVQDNFRISIGVVVGDVVVVLSVLVRHGFQEVHDA